MNDTAPDLPSIAPLFRNPCAQARPGLYQRLVINAFDAMTAGCLRLELPDGTERTFGAPGAAGTACIRVRDPIFFRRCVLFGDIGFGESYVDGDWETDSIARVIDWAIHNVETSPSMSGSKARRFALNLLQGYNRVLHLLRPNSLTTSRRNVAEHYDLGNAFYKLWLDSTMTYSSALFTTPGQSLETAQIAKYEALCRKLRITSADHVLDIGCGWGGFACHAVKFYGCRLTAVTISKQQYAHARERFEREGVADRIDLRLDDYRQLNGRFDKIVSIEMMEALGDRYLATYIAKLHELLMPHGLVGLQYITVPDIRHAELRRGVDWIQKHIFPGSLLLSVGRVNEAMNRSGDLFLHDLQDLGSSYARTLNHWWRRFNEVRDEVYRLGFDERFIRKWNYYLQYCEAAFSIRNISVVQAVYTRPNNRHLHEVH